MSEHVRSHRVQTRGRGGAAPSAAYYILALSENRIVELGGVERRLELHVPQPHVDDVLDPKLGVLVQQQVVVVVAVLVVAELDSELRLVDSVVRLGIGSRTRPLAPQPVLVDLLLGHLLPAGDGDVVLILGGALLLARLARPALARLLGGRQVVGRRGDLSKAIGVNRVLRRLGKPDRDERGEDLRVRVEGARVVPDHLRRPRLLVKRELPEDLVELQEFVGLEAALAAVREAHEGDGHVVRAAVRADVQRARCPLHVVHDEDDLLAERASMRLSAFTQEDLPLRLGHRGEGRVLLNAKILGELDRAVRALRGRVLDAELLEGIPVACSALEEEVTPHCTAAGLRIEPLVLGQGASGAAAVESDRAIQARPCVERREVAARGELAEFATAVSLKLHLFEIAVCLGSRKFCNAVHAFCWELCGVVIQVRNRNLDTRKLSEGSVRQESSQLSLKVAP